MSGPPSSLNALERHMSEAEWQSRVADYAAVQGWLRAHFRPATTARRQRFSTAVDYEGAGFPDLVLVRERVVYAELKRPGQRPTADQLVWRDRLQRAGAEHYVWLPQDWPEVMRILGRPVKHGDGAAVNAPPVVDAPVQDPAARPSARFGANPITNITRDYLTRQLLDPKRRRDRGYWPGVF